MSTIKDYKDKKISENWKYVLGDRNEEPSTFDFSNERNIKAKKAKGYADHYRYTDQEGNTAFIVEKQYTDDSQQERMLLTVKRNGLQRKLQNQDTFITWKQSKQLTTKSIRL